MGSDCTLPILTSSKTEGVILQEDHFGRKQNHDITGYNILPRNYCTYRNRSDGVDFTFNINRCCDKGIISKFYPVFYGNNCDIFFISLVLNNSNEVVREIGYTCTGTGQKVLSFLDLQKMKIRVPKYEEQKRIASYIETLDNLITLHQRQPFLHSPPDISLIVQLTPPFYTFSWEQRKFGEVFMSLQNNTLSRAELNDEIGAAQNIHYGDVLIKYDEILDVSKEPLSYIEKQSIADKFKTSYLQNGDVIIADTAEDETVGKCTEIEGLTDQKVISGLHTMPVRPNRKFAFGFLGFYLNSAAYHDQLKPLMQGIKVTSISKGAMQDTVVKFPLDLKEQEQIGIYFGGLGHLITLHQRQTIVYAVIRSIRKVILAERQYFAPPMVRKSP